jgi:hypothetical protein
MAEQNPKTRRANLRVVVLLLVLAVGIYIAFILGYGFGR